jgi:DNA mismatch repair ATPase MutS
LDKQIGDIRSNIADKELEIMQQLREQILNHHEIILYAANLIAELDWYCLA